MKMQYESKIPGKVIINGGYLVLNQKECISIVPAHYTKTTTIKILSDKPTISISTNFHDSGILNYKNKKYICENDLMNRMEYFLLIINEFYRITETEPEHQINIHLELNEVLYSQKSLNIKDSIKTGLGSSCVILIALVDSLLTVKKTVDDFIKICLQINSKLSPEASGCDIVSCIVGSCIYKKFEYKKLLLNKDWVLLLGSFNKSTSTRMMICRNFKNKKWEELSCINEQIIQSFRNKKYSVLKNLYLHYLDCLKNIDNNIVPEKQYLILQESFKFNIIGCGASGSGGEDCVWCLVDKNNLDEIYEFWKRKFLFVVALDDIGGSSKLNNVCE